MMIVLDIICALLTLLAILFIPKNKFWWLVYAFSAFLYIFVRVPAHQYGSVMVEIVAIFLGIRNYFLK
jgi:hypothetical protein